MTFAKQGIPIAATAQQRLVCQVFPNIRDSEETYDAHLTQEVWIEATDFCEVDAPGYYGLAPNKLVALRLG